MSSFSGYDEPSHHDVSVCYWNKYIFHSIVNKNALDECENIASLMENLQGNDVKGASCDSSLFDNVVINEKINDIFSFNVLYCINYNIQDIVGEFQYLN